MSSYTWIIRVALEGRREEYINIHTVHRCENWTPYSYIHSLFLQSESLKSQTIAGEGECV